MRAGCVVSLIVLVVLGMVAGTVWVGRRILQEPEIGVNPGTAADGIRGQQKIYDIARTGPGRPRPRPRQVVLSEPELNGFLSRHLTETVKVPFVVGGVRLVGDGIVEFRGQLPLGHVIAAWPLVYFVELLPRPWIERPVWLHVSARASLEVGAVRGQRRYLRLDVERFALGRQPMPETIMKLLVSPATLSLFRWRMPEAVEAITIEPGSVVVRTAS